MSVHKNFFHTSDFILYSIILLSLVLEIYFPTKLPISRLLSVIIGVCFLIFSWTIIFTAKFQFKKHKQKSGPNNETTTLIRNGLFKYSRNPIYLGVIFLGPALGFIFDNVWLLLIIVPLIILINHFLIIPEEKYLLEKFKKEYSDYYKKVRRWI